MNKSRILPVTAWIIALLASALPNIILGELFKLSLPWLVWVRVGLLSAAVVVSLVWKEIRLLRLFFIALLVICLAEWFFGDVLAGLGAWQRYFGKAYFSVRMFGTELLGVGVALVMLILMLILKRRWSAFYLVKGDWRATAAPLPVVMSKPGTWARLGWALAACIVVWTLAILLVQGQTPPEAVMMALPLLPMVVVMAAMNAFSQEMTYRAGLLTTAHEALGPQQALLLTSVYFGIAQYYGTPRGLLGALTAGVLGWLLGRSMLETKGFLWPWLLHFLQGIIVFLFMAMSSAMPGG
jgi:membrane protease YdiL (CAAX protease family)